MRLSKEHLQEIGEVLSGARITEYSPKATSLSGIASNPARIYIHTDQVTQAVQTIEVSIHPMDQTEGESQSILMLNGKLTKQSNTTFVIEDPYKNSVTIDLNLGTSIHREPKLNAK